MTIGFKYENGDRLGKQFRFGVTRHKEKVVHAAQDTAREAAREIEDEGRANIRAGGNFGSARWQQGFHAKVSFQSRTDITIRITHDVRYWVVFEEGRVIHGRPLLWIPLEFARDAQKVRARDYPAPLFRVDRPGRAPLLVSKDGPKYFGKEQVRIPRKWHLRQIVRDVARRLPAMYKRNMKRGR